jgi:hypothetical protein
MSGIFPARFPFEVGLWAYREDERLFTFRCFAWVHFSLQLPKTSSSSVVTFRPVCKESEAAQRYDTVTSGTKTNLRIR